MAAEARKEKLVELLKPPGRNGSLLVSAHGRNVRRAAACPFPAAALGGELRSGCCLSAALTTAISLLTSFELSNSRFASQDPNGPACHASHCCLPLPLRFKQASTGRPPPPRAEPHSGRVDSAQHVWQLQHEHGVPHCGHH